MKRVSVRKIIKTLAEVDLSFEEGVFKEEGKAGLHDPEVAKDRELNARVSAREAHYTVLRTVSEFGIPLGDFGRVRDKIRATRAIPEAV